MIKNIRLPRKTGCLTVASTSCILCNNCCLHQLYQQPMLQQLSLHVVMHNRCRHQQPMIQLLSLHFVKTGVWSIFPVHIIYVCCTPSTTASS
jgi:hypothetical protein